MPVPTAPWNATIPTGLVLWRIFAINGMKLSQTISVLQRKRRRWRHTCRRLRTPDTELNARLSDAILTSNQDLNILPQPLHKYNSLPLHVTHPTPTVNPTVNLTVNPIVDVLTI